MKTTQLVGLGLLAYGFIKLTEQPRVIVVPPRPAGSLNSNYQSWISYAQNVYTQAQTVYGSIQNVINVLWGPGGPFYHTPIPTYDAGSQFWQDVSGIAGIGKTYDFHQIRPNSRIDQHWRTRASEFIARQKHLGVDLNADPKFLLPEYVVQTFNLHSVEFGNWMNEADRQSFLYATAVTLRDMARVLGLSDAVMGMEQQLALALGARGNGGRAAAFYMPLPYHLINLTKPHGKGSFAHEWGHAVDFCFGVASGGDSTRKTVDGEILNRKQGPEFLFESVLDMILWNADGTPSSYQTWLAGQTRYYNMRTEIWARVCERYFHWKFQEAGINNTWGVDAKPGHDWPELRLVKRASKRIEQIFALLKNCRIAPQALRIGRLI